MKKEKVLNFLLYMIIISFFYKVVSPFIIALNYYSHKYLGHILFGVLVNIFLFGNIPTFNIKCNRLDFVFVPQNTSSPDAYGTSFTALSGPVMMIIPPKIISFVFYGLFIKKRKFKNIGITLLILFISSVFLHTFIGDILFGGTDDWIMGDEPILKYKDHPLIRRYMQDWSIKIQKILISTILLYTLHPLIYKFCTLNLKKH